MPRGRPVGSKDKTPRKRRGSKEAKGCNCSEGCQSGCKDVKDVKDVKKADVVDTLNAPEIK